MPPRKIKAIFLDCDGVISPMGRSNGLFAKDKMALLKAMVEETEKASAPCPQTGEPVLCEIVLSSAWRTTEFGRREVRKQLEANGMRTFIDCTPVDNSTTRAHEILAWIEGNKGAYTVLNWTALDDINLAASAPNRLFFIKHAILTNGMTGLTEMETKVAIDQMRDENNVC